MTGEERTKVIIHKLPALPGVEGRVRPQLAGHCFRVRLKVPALLLALCQLFINAAEVRRAHNQALAVRGDVQAQVGDVQAVLFVHSDLLQRGLGNDARAVEQQGLQDLWLQ